MDVVIKAVTWAGFLGWVCVFVNEVAQQFGSGFVEVPHWFWAGASFFLCVRCTPWAAPGSV